MARKIFDVDDLDGMILSLNPDVTPAVGENLLASIKNQPGMPTNKRTPGIPRAAAPNIGAVARLPRMPST